MEFFSYLFIKVSNVNDIIKDVVTNTFFDDSSCFSYNLATFFYLLFPDYCGSAPGAFLYKVANIFLNKHDLYEI